MKKLLVALATLPLVGCEVAQQAKEEFQAAPETFWASVKEVLLFVGQLLLNVLTGWFNGLFG